MEEDKTQARSGSAVTGSSDSGARRPVKEAKHLERGQGVERILTEA